MVFLVALLRISGVFCLPLSLEVVYSQSSTDIVLDFLVDSFNVRGQVALAGSSIATLVPYNIPDFLMHCGYVNFQISSICCVTTFFTLVILDPLMPFFDVVCKASF